MKMSLCVSVFCCATSYSLMAQAACVQPPSCEELGFTVDAAKCSGAALKCPWDLSKAACKEKITECNVENCAKCEAGKSDSCEVCKDGYEIATITQLGNTVCVREIVVPCNVLGCKTCDSDDRGLCLVCKDGFILFNGKCKLGGNINDGECQAGHTYLNCQNRSYCCPSSASITSCSQINSGSNFGARCYMLNVNDQKVCKYHSITCNGAAYCCTSYNATCSTLNAIGSGCSLK